MKDGKDIIKSYQTDRGKRYGFNFALRGIRIRRQGFYSFNEAFEMMLAIRLDIFKGDYQPGKYFNTVNKDITLKTYIRDIMLPKKKVEFKETTYRTRESECRNHIIPALGTVKLRAITVAKLEEFIATLAAKGLHRVTQQKVYTTLRMTLNEAYSSGYIDSVPEIKITAKLKKDKKILKKMEAVRLLDAIKSNQDIGEDSKNIIRIMFWTGLRIGEALALNSQDINLEEGKINVCKTLGYNCSKVTLPKNNKSQTIPLHPEAIEAIKEQIKHNDNPDGWLFKKPNSKSFMRPLKVRNNLKKVSKELFGEAEGNKVTPHELRRSLASMLVDENTPVDMVAALLRHNTKTLLASYNKANLDMLEEKLTSFQLH